MDKSSNSMANHSSDSTHDWIPNVSDWMLFLNSTQLPSLADDDIVYKTTLLASVVCNMVISTFGIAANLININVFIHQGFKDTMNISLTALAVTDMTSLLCLFWLSICHVPQFVTYVSKWFIAYHVSYLTGGLLRNYFTLVGSWLTVFIASERCLCIVKPFKVKFLVTKGRLLVILILTFILSFTPNILIYISVRLEWRQAMSSSQNGSESRNISTGNKYLGLAFTKDRQTMDSIAFALSVVFLCGSFALVCACTGIIIVTMNKHAKWRKRHANSHLSIRTISSATIPNDIGISQFRSTSKPKQQRSTMDTTEESKTTTKSGDESMESEEDSCNKSGPTKDPNTNGISSGKTPVVMSSKDVKVTRTVTLIAVIFIICYLPSTSCRLTMVLVPDFSKGGRYGSEFELIWSFCFMAEAISSCANIFVYVKTSTKFKNTFKALLYHCN